MIALSFFCKGKRCENLVDVGFIVDSSGSLRREYAKEKDFVKSLASSFDLSANGSRAGVITFSWHAEHSIKLNDHRDLDTFLSAVDSLPLFGHTTRIDKALKMAKSDMFSAENGGRTNVPKLIILLTDGSQTKDADAVDPGMIAGELRKAGIKLIVIGIGKNVDSNELSHMAGDVSNVYQASNFDQLISSSFIDRISKSSCEQSKTLRLYIGLVV